MSSDPHEKQHGMRFGPLGKHKAGVFRLSEIDAPPIKVMAEFRALEARGQGVLWLEVYANGDYLLARPLKHGPPDPLQGTAGES